MAEGTPGEVVGRNLRTLRERGLYSRTELAERSGVSEPGITRLELGMVSRPRRTTLERLARVLDVPVETLLEQEAAPAPLAEARRPEEAFRVVGRIVKDEAGNDQRRWTVKWNVPEEERDQHRALIAQLIGSDDYDEETLTPEQAVVLMAGVV